MSPFLRTPRRFFSFALQIATLLMPSLLHAATYYVRPGGSDSNSGLSTTAAWATIGKANATVRPGDVVLVSDGTYAHFPNPAVPGTSSARITYVGNLANPLAVAITSGSTTLTAAHVTLKGFDVRSGFTVRGNGDSVAWCRAGGSRTSIVGADDATIARCTIDSKRFWIVGAETDTLVRSERCRVTDNQISLNPDDLVGHTVRLAVLDDLQFERNRLRIRIAAGAVGASATKLFHVRNSRFVDSHWDIATACMTGCDEAGWFVNRDFTRNNSWVRDTILLDGPGKTQFFASCSGSYPGTVMNNTWDQVLIRQIGPSDYGFTFFYQDQAKWDRVTNCVFVGSRTSFKFNQAVNGPMVVERNVFAAFDPATGVVDFGNTPWNGITTFRHNILYGPPNGAHGSRGVALGATPAHVVGKLVSNRNYFYSAVSKDSMVLAAGVGPSAVGLGTRWNNSARADSNSWYGSPRFVDTSSVATFNARLLPGSPAAGKAIDGTDLGAFSAIDQIAPAVVADLGSTQVFDRSIQLSWTAPGDDGMSGTANGYELRWSILPIDAANFANATAVNPAPTPASPGTRQQHTVTGLTEATRYWFAIRTRDEAGNWSAPSTAVSFVTRSDMTPPANIGDLGAR